MRIISDEFNKSLTEMGLQPIKSMASGATRSVCGAVQLAFNLLALAFSPLTCCCLRRDSEWSYRNCKKDAFASIAHIIYGALEFLPGSSCFLKKPQENIESSEAAALRDAVAARNNAAFDEVQRSVQSALADTEGLHDRVAEVIRENA